MVKVNLKGRDFISINDFTIEEIHTLMDNAFDMKRMLSRGEPHEFLKRKSLGMIFGWPSTRTRVSFETAMTQLGGHAQNLEQLHALTGAEEPWSDTARVLTRYLDGIACRLPEDATLREIAKYSYVPVISMGTFFEHPCQAMADMMTIKEQKGKWEGIKCVFQWGWRPKKMGPMTMASDLLLAPKLGVDIVINNPPGFDPDEQLVKWAKEDADITGSTVEVTNDYKGAVEGADVIRQMSWAPSKAFDIPNEELPQIKEPEKYKPWIVNQELMDLANKDVIFLQGLPCMRGYELTDEVIEGPHSRVWDEAENRLHAQKAVLACTMR